MHAYNRNKNILILDEGPTDELPGTKTAEN